MNEYIQFHSVEILKTEYLTQFNLNNQWAHQSHTHTHSTHTTLVAGLYRGLSALRPWKLKLAASL